MEPKDQPSATGASLGGGTEKAAGVCAAHLMECKLFCVNCSVTICGRCIEGGQPHELHHIDNFSIVYREKLTELESKLAQAKKTIDALGVRTAVCGWNLKLLEKEEADTLKEIEAVAASSRQKVSRLTGIRKERLRAQLQVPVERGETLKALRNTVKQHSAGDFMKNLSKFSEICSTLVTSPANGGSVPLETVDDIECDLVPACRFGKYSATGFFQPGNFNYSYSLAAPYDVVWEVTVMKTDRVHVKLNPNDPELLKFPHKLVVVIPHTDSAKEVRAGFEITNSNTTFEVTQVARLVTLGFNSLGQDLVMTIGIRSLNAVVEKRVLNYQYEQMKKQKLNSELRLGTVQAELLVITSKMEYNHFVMNYTLDMNQFYKHWDTNSFHIVDDDDRRWCLQVCPKNKIGAYIELYEGEPTNCSYFIQLRHEDPAKTITNMASYVFFDEMASNGWHCIIKWNQLMNDDGFYPDGFLRFRFGVRPLAN